MTTWLSASKTTDTDFDYVGTSRRLSKLASRVLRPEPVPVSAHLSAVDGGRRARWVSALADVTARLRKAGG